MQKSTAIALALLLAGAAVTAIRLDGKDASPALVESSEAKSPVAVAVVAIERGVIERRRGFSGTVQASAQLVVTSEVAGRVRHLHVDMADPIERGQLVAELDDAAYLQALREAQAQSAVARAQRRAAQHAADIANKRLERIQTLTARGIATAQELDDASAQALVAAASLDVARAQLERAHASAQLAQINLDQTKIAAEWTRGDAHRVVAARHIDDGQLVSAGTPLITIVDLDPVEILIDVTEKDYPAFAGGQRVELRVDAHPSERLQASVLRIAPVFQAQSRQARVELSAANSEGKLKPGMFVRAEAVFERVEDAVIVPEDALVEEDGRELLYVVDGQGSARFARRVVVRTGLRQSGRVQLVHTQLAGLVVTLGKERLRDGTPIVIPERQDLHETEGVDGPGQEASP